MSRKHDSDHPDHREPDGADALREELARRLERRAEDALTLGQLDRAAHWIRALRRRLFGGDWRDRARRLARRLEALRWQRANARRRPGPSL